MPKVQLPYFKNVFFLADQEEYMHQRKLRHPNKVDISKKFPSFAVCLIKYY